MDNDPANNLNGKKLVLVDLGISLLGGKDVTLQANPGSHTHSPFEQLFFDYELDFYDLGKGDQYSFFVTLLVSIFPKSVAAQLYDRSSFLSKNGFNVDGYYKYCLSRIEDSETASELSYPRILLELENFYGDELNGKQREAIAGILHKGMSINNSMRHNSITGALEMLIAAFSNPQIELDESFVSSSDYDNRTAIITLTEAETAT